MKNNNNHLLIIAIALIACLIIPMIYSGSKDHIKTLLVNYNEKKIYKTPASYNEPKELVKAGFADIDATQTLDKLDGKLSTFLKKVDNNQWAVLKVASKMDDELCVTLDIYDDRIHQIRTDTAMIKRQGSYGPDRRYKSYYVKSESGINYIWLAGTANYDFPTHPLTDDAILCSYRE